VFRQCPHGRGLGQLREELARRVQAAVQARKTAPEGGAHAIGHNGWMNSREIDECSIFQRVQVRRLPGRIRGCST
jgi:hypothetical protein